MGYTKGSKFATRAVPPQRPVLTATKIANCAVPVVKRCPTPVYCGDGVKQPQEECEDGNQAAGDGCAPNCVVETGYTCSTFGCFPLCGDGLLRDTESCDDGNGISGDGCSAQCEAEHGFVCTGSEPASCHADCGDGLVASTEACDDGNLAGGDGCSELCTPEPGYFCDLTGRSGRLFHPLR